VREEKGSREIIAFVGNKAHCGASKEEKGNVSIYIKSGSLLSDLWIYWLLLFGCSNNKTMKKTPRWRESSAVERRPRAARRPCPFSSTSNRLL
jgi:hypothetical protein